MLASKNRQNLNSFPKILVNLGIVLLSSCVLIAGSYSAFSQTSNKALIKLHPIDTQPADISLIKIGEQVVLPGKSVDANEQWIKELQLRVKNTSDKIVKFVLVKLWFSLDTDGKPILPEHYFFQGQNLLISPNDPTNKHYLASRHYSGEITLLPGEELDLQTAQDAVQGIYERVKTKNIPQRIVNNIVITVEAVVFDDDTAWIMGNKSVRDKNNPQTWVNVQDKDTVIYKPASYSTANLKTKPVVITNPKNYGACKYVTSVTSALCYTEADCYAYTQNLANAQSYGKLPGPATVACRMYQFGIECQDFWTDTYITPWSPDCTIVKSNSKKNNITVGVDR